MEDLTRYDISGQKNALTQETELLESILQEVEHQVRQFFSSHNTICKFTLLLGPYVEKFDLNFSRKIKEVGAFCLKYPRI